MKFRLRYAPSPTGFFHVGGARTALFNYLYAKHMGGDFILRIEDTDQERNVEGGIESQINNLEWMGIKIDESIKNPGPYGPYIQTQKLKRYQELAYKLIEEGKAYRCFCTKEDLDKNREKSMSSGQTPKYNRHCLYLTKEEIQAKLDANEKGLLSKVISVIRENSVITLDNWSRKVPLTYNLAKYKLGEKIGDMTSDVVIHFFESSSAIRAIPLLEYSLLLIV